MAILGISNAVGFRAGSEKIITDSLFGKLKVKEKLWDTVANKNVQRAFGLFTKKPILSGRTKNSTKAMTFWGGKRLVIRFKTPNNFASGDGKQRGYAVFPLLGLSTSAKEGDRNWLAKGANLTLNEIIK
jgi:hypothetical protein